MAWKFHWLTKWDEIWNESFVSQWQRWLDNSPSAHVFFHPALVRAWVETYMPLRDIRPCFLIAEASGQTVFFPLVLWRRNWKNAFQRLLIPVGYSDYDYHDPIITGEENLFDWPMFWHDVIEFIKNNAPQSYDRMIIDGIRKSFAGSSSGWRNDTICPWTDLTSFQHAEDFLPSLKSSLRGDLRRQLRRMQEKGKVSSIIYDRYHEKEALAELEPFLQAHSRRWPGAYKAPSFHENIIKQGLASGILHYSVLRMNEIAAAWHLGFVYLDRLYYYLPAQNEEFDRLSPGKVLLLRCVEDAITRKLQIFDHLRGEENYKAGWTDKKETIKTFMANNKKMISLLSNLCVDKIKHKISISL